MAFPIVATRIDGVETTDSTSHPITLPAGVVSGNFLVVIYSVDANPTITTSSTGWVKLGQSANGSVVAQAIFYKVATGSDALTLTSSATAHGSWISYRITTTINVITGTASNGSSATPDPPLHTPAGGAKDFLWIVTRGGDVSSGAGQPTGAPTDFTDLRFATATEANGANTAAAEHTLNAASLNPSAFTGAPNEQWVCYTLAIEGPAGAVAPVVDAGTNASTGPNSVFNRTAIENDQGAAITSRAWTIESGPTGVGTTIGTAAALSWTPTVTGTYTLRYSATNSEGTGFDEVDILVISGVKVRAATGNGQSAVPVPTIIRPDGVVEGDLMIVGQVSDIDGTLAAMTAPSGWTLLHGETLASAGHFKVWEKVATASEPSTYAFPDSTGAHCSIGFVALFDYDQVNPYAAAITIQTTSTAVTGHTAPSVTGVVDGTLLTIHMSGHNTSGSRSYTPPAGMTERVDANDGASLWVAMCMNTELLAANGATGTKTATISEATRALCASLVVAPVVATGQEFTLGLITDSSTLYALDVDKNATLGSVTDSATLNAVKATKNITLGLITDTATLNAVTAVKNRTLGSVTDSATLNAVKAVKQVTLGTITDSATLNSLTAVKQRTLGSVTETGTIFGPLVPQLFTLDLITDSATLESVKATKTRTLDSVTESSTQYELKATKTVTLGSITDSVTIYSPQVSVPQSFTLGLITDSATLNDLKVTKPVTLGQVTETGTVNALAKQYTLGSITSGTTFYRPGYSKTLGLIVSDTEVNALSYSVSGVLPTIISASQLFHLTKHYTLGTVTETGTLNNLKAQKLEILDVITVADTINSLQVEKRCTLGNVTESITLYQLGIQKRATLTLQTETTTIFSLSGGSISALDLITGSSTLFPLAVTKPIQLGLVTGTYSINDLFTRKECKLSTVTEIGVINQLSVIKSLLLGEITSTGTLFNPLVPRLVALQTVIDSAQLFSLVRGIVVPLPEDIFGDAVTEVIFAVVTTTFPGGIVSTENKLGGVLTVANIEGSVESSTTFANVGDV